MDSTFKVANEMREKIKEHVGDSFVWVGSDIRNRTHPPSEYDTPFVDLLDDLLRELDQLDLWKYPSSYTNKCK